VAHIRPDRKGALYPWVYGVGSHYNQRKQLKKIDMQGPSGSKWKI